MDVGLKEQVINYGIDIPSISFTIESCTINEGEDFTELVLTSEFTNVIWSDGQTGNSAMFYEEGIYQVEAFYNCQKIIKEI